MCRTMLAGRAQAFAGIGVRPAARPGRAGNRSLTFGEERIGAKSRFEPGLDDSLTGKLPNAHGRMRPIYYHGPGSGQKARIHRGLPPPGRT